jgi:hypothetical protein
MFVETNVIEDLKREIVEAEQVSKLRVHFLISLDFFGLKKKDDFCFHSKIST